MDFIKLNINHLVKEPTCSNGCDRYSHPAFTRKLPKETTPCDYDPVEKKIEVEYSNGEKYWFPISTFFGVVIAEAKTIYLIDNEDDRIDKLSIVGIDTLKVKRTMYWKLIFQVDLPF